MHLNVNPARKRGQEMAKLSEAILLLIEGKPLRPCYKDYSPGGDWKHFRDCHIEPDSLLVYKIDARTSTSFEQGRTRICSETVERPACHVSLRSRPGASPVIRSMTREDRLLSGDPRPAAAA